MDRIAVIADIHGNHFALQAVIDDLEQRGVEEVIVAGDLVGRGPQGTAVVKRIQSLGWKCVRGNHEDYLLSFWRDDIPDAWRHTEQWAASRWMADNLDAQAAEFIDSLPFRRHSALAPELVVFHGSPNSHSEGIGDWTSEQRLDEHLQAIDGSLLVCAHTHRPLHYQSSAGTIVNVGSVGLPFNGDWRAQYATFDGGGQDWEVSFHQVPYPRQRLLEHYKSSGFLRDGAITAQLLYREVEYARPFLVPFLKWADITNRPPTTEHLPAFLQDYDPRESMFEFLERISGSTQ